MGTRFFLGKGGQQFGPYSEAQIQAMRESGELATYTWLWDERKAAWEPVDSAPSTPAAGGAPGPVPPDNLKPTQAEPAPVRAAVHAPVDEMPSARASQRATARYYQTTLKAVCMNQDQTMTAALSKVSDDGCDLLSATQCASPQFVSSTQAVLNLFDEKSGKSVNVPVKIASVARNNGVWTYRIRWRECPELVQATAA